MTVPSHPVQGINRIRFGAGLGRLAWPHVTGGMDTEPPDDDSMGGRDESQQGTRQKMHFCQRPVQRKKNCGPQKRNKFRDFFPPLIFIFSAFTFSSVSTESTQEAIMREVRPKTSWPSGRIRAYSEVWGGDAGCALQTDSWEEGGEKDKYCQDRNEVHQYLITEVLYLRLLPAER